MGSCEQKHGRSGWRNPWRGGRFVRDSLAAPKVQQKMGSTHGVI